MYIYLYEYIYRYVHANTHKHLCIYNTYMRVFSEKRDDSSNTVYEKGKASLHVSFSSLQGVSTHVTKQTGKKKLSEII